MKIAVGTNKSGQPCFEVKGKFVVIDNNDVSLSDHEDLDIKSTLDLNEGDSVDTGLTYTLRNTDKALRIMLLLHKDFINITLVDKEMFIWLNKAISTRGEEPIIGHGQTTTYNLCMQPEEGAGKKEICILQTNDDIFYFGTDEDNLTYQIKDMKVSKIDRTTSEEIGNSNIYYMFKDLIIHEGVYNDCTETCIYNKELDLYGYPIFLWKDKSLSVIIMLRDFGDLSMKSNTDIVKILGGLNNERY